MKIRFALAGIMAGALAIRLLPIGAGLPYSFWLDEVNYVEAALRLGTGNFTMTSYCHGGLYQIILFAEYAAYYLSLLAGGAARSALDFLLQYVRDPSAFFILARATAALSGAGAVFLTYKIASEIYSVRTALIAALFSAFSLVMLQMSFFGLADVPSVFILLLSYTAIVYSMKTPEERRIYYLAALLAGLAAACKYHTVFGAAGIFLAAFVKSREGRLGTARLIQLAASGSVLIFAGFIIGMPFSAVNPSGFCRDALLKNFGEYVLLNPHKHSWLVYFTEHLRNGLGLPLEIFCILGIVSAFLRRSKWDLLMLSFPAAYYLVFMNSNVLAYNVMPAAPFLLILGARLVDRLSERYFARNRSIACFVLAGALVAPTFIDSTKFVMVTAGRDTRVLAKEWIESNIEEGATILAEGYIHGRDVHGAPLCGDLRTAERDLGGALRGGGSGRDIKERIANFGALYKNRKLYNIIKREYLTAGDLSEGGAEYAILTGDNDYAADTELSHLVSDEYKKERQRMKRYLEERYRVIKSFSPTERLSFAFPHILEPDYAVLRNRPLAGFVNYTRGPELTIFRKNR